MSTEPGSYMPDTTPCPACRTTGAKSPTGANQHDRGNSPTGPFPSSDAARIADAAKAANVSVNSVSANFGSEWPAVTAGSATYPRADQSMGDSPRFRWAGPRSGLIRGGNGA